MYRAKKHALVSTVCPLAACTAWAGEPGVYRVEEGKFQSLK